MKSIVIKPITGFLDLRSEPEDVPIGGYRYAQNVFVAQKNKLCRATGWSRLMDREEGYNNQDFHDQLFTLTGRSVREKINFQFEAESTFKVTMLLAGTPHVLMALNVGTGNYRMLTNTMGDWKWAAQNRDIVVLTNDRDRPQHWVFDAATIAPIPDLEALGITQVGVVITWRGVTFYMNVVEKGRTFANRILWSDLDNALSLFPGENSIAGDLDLDSGESILAAKPLGNILLIYTTRGIWQLGVAGDEEIFGATKRYDPEKTGEAVLAYPRTLVGTGDTHLYAGRSGIYEYSLFEPKPKLVEWVHRASAAMFNELDRDNCDGPCAGYEAEKHQVWLSWVALGATLPARSLVLNTQFPFASIVDHGFTSFGQFMPHEPVVILRDWLLETCVCTEAEIIEFFGAVEREGGQCQAPDPVVCETQPDAFYTTVEQALEDDIIMEDWNEEEPSADSLCVRMNGISLAELCQSETEADQCNATRLFVMASAADFTLKQTTENYYREVATVFTPCGLHVPVGYKSILRSGPLAFKNVDDEKIISNFIAEGTALASAAPGQIILRVGASMQALDPNLDCGIVWQEQVPLALECLQVRTESQHLQNNTRPDGRYEWPLYWTGMNVYYELTLGNADSDPIDIGAAACFSKFVLEIQPSPMRY